MKSVLFILSAAYADPELQAEFGAKIPACAVPIGPDTLLRKQVEEAFKIQGMRHVFIAVPPGTEPMITDIVGNYMNKEVSIYEMDTADMKETHDKLVDIFKFWLDTPLCGAERSLFIDDQWMIHVLNGDTLLSSSVLGGPSGIAITSEEYTPFNWQRGERGVFVGKFSYLVKVEDLITDSAVYAYDKAMAEASKFEVQVDESNWFDFGHLSTYYRSKRNLLSTRHFNTISLNARGNLVKKSTADRIAAETGWYANIPPALQMYTPRVRQVDVNSYEMEYIAAPSLAELLVYGRHPLEWWNNIWNKLSLFLETARREFRANTNDWVFDDPMLLTKSEGRVELLREPYKVHAKHVISWMRQQNYEHTLSYVHGDLCFSNILYDQRTDNIHVIDPRGAILGSQLYDVAKIYHSTYACYDLIVANMPPNEKEANAAVFIGRRIDEYVTKVYGLERTVLLGATALLFYSMLPLHRDNAKRVRRLLNKAEELYEEWVKEV
jgi:hypothetical protein